MLCASGLRLYAAGACDRPVTNVEPRLHGPSTELGSPIDWKAVALRPDKYKIVVIGEPRAGKSTFIVGMYLAANRNTADYAHSLVATDQRSQSLIRDIVNDYQKHGELPDTATDRFTQFDFMFLQDGRRTLTAPVFSWHDYSGEYFALIKKGEDLPPETRRRQERETANSDACCLMLDAESLFNCHDEDLADRLGRLCECVHNMYETRRPCRHPYPVPLIFTKVDKIAPEFSNSEMLENRLGRLKKYLSSDIFKSQPFLSSIRTVQSDSNGSYRMEVAHTNDAVFWLVPKLLFVHQPPLWVRVLRWPDDLAFVAAGLFRILKKTWRTFRNRVPGGRR